MTVFGRRIGVLTLVAIGLTLAALVCWLIWLSPVFSVRHVRITGEQSVAESEITAALAIPEGTPLMQVNTGAAADRIARLPRVAQGRVEVDFPSTIRVHIIERVALVYFDGPQGTHLMDSTGVDFATEPPPPGVPKLVTAHPRPGDSATKAALQVLVTTSDALRAQIRTINARTMSDITLVLRDGREVEWGSATDSQRKAQITIPLLTQPGHTYDVSSPDLPTIK